MIGSFTPEDLIVTLFLGYVAAIVYVLARTAFEAATDVDGPVALGAAVLEWGWGRTDVGLVSRFCFEVLATTPLVTVGIFLSLQAPPEAGRFALLGTVAALALAEWVVRDGRGVGEHRDGAETSRHVVASLFGSATVIAVATEFGLVPSSQSFDVLGRAGSFLSVRSLALAAVAVAAIRAFVGLTERSSVRLWRSTLLVSLACCCLALGAHAVTSGMIDARLDEPIRATHVVLAIEASRVLAGAFGTLAAVAVVQGHLADAPGRNGTGGRPGSAREPAGEE